MDSNIYKIKKKIKKLEQEGRLKNTKQYLQHGNKSVYDHVIRVTATSLMLVDKLNLSIDEDSLIRGALLHDYFLYDWHEKDKAHSWHGFTHAKTALQRAREDYELNEIEEDIIAHHMFPLNFTPPKHKEAWVVSIADKICAGKETLQPYQTAILKLFQKDK